MRTLTSEGIGVFIVDKSASLSLDQKSFPYRNPYEHILQDPFFIGVFFITIARETQEISLYIFTWRPSQGFVRTVSLVIPFILVISASNISQELMSSTLQTSWFVRCRHTQGRQAYSGRHYTPCHVQSEYYKITLIIIHAYAQT